MFFFFQAEDGIRDYKVTGVQTCALPIFIISCLGQLAFPARVAAASAWGNAPGWQREIGFWNVAMYIVIARTLRANDPAGARTLAIALVVLQLLAATNHVVAAIQSQTQLNTIMSLVNYG